MFLNRLNEKEKVAFLEIAHNVARSDDNYSDSEKLVIKQYCDEMQIEDISYNKDTFDLKNSLSKIESKENQNIFLIELMALVYSDSVLDKNEQEILDVIINEFGLNSTVATIYGEWSKAMLALYTQGNELIKL